MGVISFMIEIMANAWNQYRQGLVYAIQHSDFSSAILYTHGMQAMLPESAQPKFDAIPTISQLVDDIMYKRRQWDWLFSNMPKVERSISLWIHSNWDRKRLG